jgi:hypothetical protein
MGGRRHRVDLEDGGTCGRVTRRPCQLSGRQLLLGGISSAAFPGCTRALGYDVIERCSFCVSRH